LLITVVGLRDVRPGPSGAPAHSAPEFWGDRSRRRGPAVRRSPSRASAPATWTPTADRPSPESATPRHPSPATPARRKPLTTQARRSGGAFGSPAAPVVGAGGSAVAEAWNRTRRWRQCWGVARGGSTVAGGSWGTFCARCLGARGVASR
jgi:hypothetical protein